MPEFEIKPELHKKFVKLSKKDKRAYEAIINKIQEIINSDDVNHYKNLRYDIKVSKRVHIGHFVLVFSYDKQNDFVSFEYHGHQDNFYNM